MKKENIHQTDRKNNKGCAYFVIALFILIPGFLSALFGGAGVFKGHIEFFLELNCRNTFCHKCRLVN